MRDSIQPLISICLPVFDGERFLAQAIESVLDQTFADFELLISDDCSTDTSAAIIISYLNRDSRIKYHQNKVNAGLFANYNKLIGLASGKYIKLFAQDDILHKNMLAACVNALESDSDCVLVSTARNVIDENNMDISAERGLASISNRFDSRQKFSGLEIIQACLFPLLNLIGEPSTVMYRATAVGKGFDLSLHQLGDLEYWLRIMLEGNYCFIDQLLCSFRHHIKNTSTANFKGLYSAIDMLRIGALFSPLIQKLGRTEQEFISVNLRHFSVAVRDWVREGKLSLNDVKSVDSALLNKLKSLPDVSKSTELVVADLANFRELCFRMMIMLGAIIPTESSKRASSDLMRNEKLIRQREQVLCSLLNSRSWKTTKPLRDFNYLLKLSKAPDDNFIPENNKLDETIGSLAKQRNYLKYLRTRIIEVLSSRSWRLAAPFRSKTQSKFLQNRSKMHQTEMFVLNPMSNDHDESAREIYQKNKWAGVGIPESLDRYQAWQAVNHWNIRCELHVREQLSVAEKNLPTISVIVPVFNPELRFLAQAVDSLNKQIYTRWQLCIADDASTDPSVREYLEVIAANQKIDVIFRKTNGHISEATNSAASLANGDFLLFLDQDDEISIDALAEAALYIAHNSETDFLYSDNDKIDAEGHRYDPHFKPDWSPETLLSYMYACQLMVVRRSVFEAMGGMRSGYEGSQDHDLALRVSECARHVGHIPKILYHWRSIKGSISLSGNFKPYSIEAGRKAVQDALIRRGSAGEVVQHEWARLSGAGGFSIQFPDQGPAVTIIIPTKNSIGLLKQCLESLLQTSYQNYEILIVDNSSDDPIVVDYLQSTPHRVVRIANEPGKPFNYSYLMNRAVELVDTDYLLFLNNDTQVLNPEWLSSMVGYAQLPDVGVVGALLYYSDARIQHAGVVHGLNDGLCGHAYRNLPSALWGQACHNIGIARNYSAVSASCMITGRQLFLKSGGFDEETFPVCYSDIDYCYRLVDRGYRIVCSPNAKLVHHEGSSRGMDVDPDANAAYRKRYHDRNDPYYSPNLSKLTEFFEIEPRRVTTCDKMSIKVLVYTHNLNLEGAPKAQLAVVRYLKTQGVIDPVVISRLDGPLRSEYESNDIPVYIKNPIDLGQWSHQNYQEWLNILQDLIIKFGIQLVYANTLIAFDAIDASHNLNIPSIWNIHESNPWQGLLNALPQELAARAIKCFGYPYKVVFGSFATEKQYQELDTVHNFTVIHNGLEKQPIDSRKNRWTRASARESLNIDSNEIVVLLLGTVCERKGQRDLVESLQHMEAQVGSRLRILIVGDKNLEYSQELRLIADLLPDAIGKRVSLVAPTDDTMLFYRSADIFVCTSREECYPLVILEAMYYGLPIITTPVFGIKEQVVAGINADFYCPGEAKELAAKITDLVNDEPRRKAYATASSKVFAGLCSEIETGDSFARIFKEAYFTNAPVHEQSTQVSERALSGSDMYSTVFSGGRQ